MVVLAIKCPERFSITLFDALQQRGVLGIAAVASRGHVLSRIEHFGFAGQPVSSLLVERVYCVPQNEPSPSRVELR